MAFYSAMSECRFARPVEVVLVADGGQPRVALIDNARDAIRAMNEGLGRFPLNNPEWQRTFMVLGQAVVDPTPEKLEAARDAFERLASVRSDEPMDGVSV
jgi:hypothetical protein